MSLGHYVLAVVIATIACSLTDWLFMGVLFHERYKQHPEVWRTAVATGSDSKAVAWSMLLTVVTCMAFVYVTGAFVLPGFSRALAVTVIVWLAIPVPLLVTNSLFIKLHPLVVASHCLGWLAKLLVCCLSASYWL
ncbi:MAG TPA: DUF1761 domain-containing protein [Rhodanobacteraceae bacterium]|nr:DUF1761 domain-containing protein [Rhodanobacteraceae bacterium]